MSGFRALELSMSGGVITCKAAVAYGPKEPLVVEMITARPGCIALSRPAPPAPFSLPPCSPLPWLLPERAARRPCTG